MIGIIGAIVGDLIGQSYEFKSTKDYNKYKREKKLLLAASF